MLDAALSRPCSVGLPGGPCEVQLKPDTTNDTPIKSLDAPAAAEESQHGARELRRRLAEHRAVAAVGHDPEIRSRDRAVQLERQRDRIERIAIAEHDQG